MTNKSDLQQSAKKVIDSLNNLSSDAEFVEHLSAMRDPLQEIKCPTSAKVSKFTIASAPSKSALLTSNKRMRRASPVNQNNDTSNFTDRLATTDDDAKKQVTFAVPREFESCGEEGTSGQNSMRMNQLGLNSKKKRHGKEEDKAFNAQYNREMLLIGEEIPRRSHRINK